MTLDDAVAALSRPPLKVFIFDREAVHGGVPGGGVLSSPYFVIAPEGGAWVANFNHATEERFATLADAVAHVRELLAKALGPH